MRGNVRPMIILKREPARRKKGYFELTVQPEDAQERAAFEEQLGFGDSFSLEVSEEILFRRSLTKGDRIPLEELTKLMAADELVKARDTALKLLDYRMRTVKEVQDKLKEKGFSQETVTRTIETLEEYRFLDDESYAREYLKGRIAQRGIRAIEQELSRKGVHHEITRELTEDMEDAEYEAAVIACRKKYRSLQGREPEEQKRKEKVYRFLMSRGYNYDLIRRVYEEIREEAWAGDEG